MQHEQLFNYLQGRDTLRLESEVAGLRSTRELPARLAENSLFPHAGEDYKFLQMIWPVVEKFISTWILAQSADGHQLQRLMKSEITFARFMQKLEDKHFLKRMRRKIFSACLRHFDASRNELLIQFYSSYLIPVYTPTLELDAETSTSVRDLYYKYYRGLGYFVNGKLIINEKSIYYLAAKGRIPCNVATFNLALFPWEYEASLLLQGDFLPEGHHHLQSYGWSKSQLIAAIVQNSRETEEKVSTLSKIELITYLREIFGSDYYVDVNSIRSTHYLSREALGILAVKSFGISPDICATASYDELLDRIQELTNERQLEHGQKALDSASFKDYGITHSGIDCVLHRNYEGMEKSFWYTDFTGKINLMVNFTPISDQLLPLDYKSLLKYSKHAEEVTTGYFVLISQKIGLWPLVLHQGMDVNSPGLREQIHSYLREMVEMQPKK